MDSCNGYARPILSLHEIVAALGACFKAGRKAATAGVLGLSADELRRLGVTVEIIDAEAPMSLDEEAVVFERIMLHAGPHLVLCYPSGTEFDERGCRRRFTGPFVGDRVTWVRAEPELDDGEAP